MRGDGDVIQTWSVKPKGESLRRLYALFDGVGKVFYQIKEDQEIRDRLESSEVRVYIEEGMYGGGKEPIRMMARNSALVGEARGTIITLAWLEGWKVNKMAIASWKSLLTKTERAMPKNSEYVRYWNISLGLDASSPDEIDAYFIARRAVRGKA
jgi:hypothetical protein